MDEWVGEIVGPDVWETCRDLIQAGSVFAFLASPRVKARLNNRNHGIPFG